MSDPTGAWLGDAAGRLLLTAEMVLVIGDLPPISIYYSRHDTQVHYLRPWLVPAAFRLLRPAWVMTRGRIKPSDWQVLVTG
jgi:hypothetical protein